MRNNDVGRGEASWLKSTTSREHPALKGELEENFTSGGKKKGRMGEPVSSVSVKEIVSRATVSSMR